MTNVIPFPGHRYRITSRGMRTIDGEPVIAVAVRGGQVRVLRLRDGKLVYEWMDADRVFLRAGPSDRPCDTEPAA